MIIDVVLVFIVATVLIIGFFLAKTAPLLRSDAAREAVPHHRPGDMYLIESRLHETEGPETVDRPGPFAGAAASMAAARDHFVLADDYDDAWHRRFPDEPPAHRSRETAPVILEPAEAEPEALMQDHEYQGVPAPEPATRAPAEGTLPLTVVRRPEAADVRVERDEPVPESPRPDEAA